MNTRSTAALVSTLALIAGSSLLMAGPLNPPAGAVSASMKTLAEVEARTAVTGANTPGDATAVHVISQPGSYYLTGNIAAPAGKSAVRIVADNVTLDLNGFCASTAGATGTVISAGYQHATVLNGHVSGGGIGVSASFAARISGLGVKGCAFDGISAGGETTVIDCTVTECQGTGISVSNWRTIVERCHVAYCGSNGISVGRDSRLVSCTATGNAGHGFDFAGTATGCTASDNGADGFIATYASVMDSCTARDNAGKGFWMLNGSSARGCSSLSNNSYGYELEQDSSLSGCTANSNAVSAVRVSGPATAVEGCTLRGVGGFPVVLLSTVSGARIERNSMFNGTFAVSADAATANVLIVGNQCVGNTSGAFNVTLANNQVGPTVSAGGTIASTSPWANFVR